MVDSCTDKQMVDLIPLYTGNWWTSLVALKFPFSHCTLVRYSINAKAAKNTKLTTIGHLYNLMLLAASALDEPGRAHVYGVRYMWNFGTRFLQSYM